LITQLHEKLGATAGFRIHLRMNPLMRWKNGNKREHLSEQGIDQHGRITVIMNLPIEYPDKPVTPFGDMVLMKH